MSKIKYDDSNKSTIINNLNNCINILNDININFDNLYIPYNFYYKNSLKNLKYDLKNNKDNLIKYKNSIINDMNKISKNELELQSKINKIDNIIISENDI